MTRPSVLLVEADILVRHPLAEYLRECGYRVLEAFDGNEARQLLSGASIAIDIVLADVDAPDESGFVLAAWIRGNRPGVAVVLAGSVTRAAEKAGDLCREGPGLAKPYEHQQVLNEIRRLLAARERNEPGQ
jgi:DNA-binding response OmpR family regulator